jgi:uncharacterized small protein (DUF1192 family)
VTIDIRRDSLLTGQSRIAGLALYWLAGEPNMATNEEDDRPKKKPVHDIGQDLALLSVEELSERMALLKEEIARLEAAAAKKRASRSAADLFFKK